MVVNTGESSYTAIDKIDLDLLLLNVFRLCMNVCSQMNLSAVVLKSPLRITHLRFLSKWSGWLK